MCARKSLLNSTLFGHGDGNEHDSSTIMLSVMMNMIMGMMVVMMIGRIVNIDEHNDEHYVVIAVW